MDSGIEYLMGGWKARAEAAEARVKVLEDALREIHAEGMANHNTRCRKWWPTVSQALGGEYER